MICGINLRSRPAFPAINSVPTRAKIMPIGNLAPAADAILAQEAQWNYRVAQPSRIPVLSGPASPERTKSQGEPAMSKADADEPELVRAAQRGDQRARDALVNRCLPLVYNIVGRALSGQPDIDDVVQETMLRVVRDLSAVRNPEGFRSWVGAIAVHQLSTHWRQADETARHATALAGVPEPAWDFEELAVLHLRLSGQRREVAEASRWLDGEDRVLLSLWWLEAAGEMTRAEVTAALGTTAAYAAVRIQRMRNQLELNRSVVSALTASQCAELGLATDGWNGRPSPLWRKRIARHVRDCVVCGATARERIAAERLLVGYGLLPVPAALAAAVTRTSATTGARVLTIGRASRSIRANPATAASAAIAVIALAVACTLTLAHHPRLTPPPNHPLQAVQANVAQNGPTRARSVPPRPVTAAPASGKTRAPAPSARKTPAADPARSPAGCGTSLADVWADWAMPNSPGTGLPNPASYTDRANGTVRDNVTCLVWQGTPAPGTYTFTQAKAYCAGLGLAGGGWHLPTRIQLISIIDTSRFGPAIDTEAFPRTAAAYFWTSSPWVVTKTPLRAWIVNFYEGLTSNAAYQSGAYQVRCVQSADGAGGPDYQIADGQVTDSATGLTWQQAASSQIMTATEATAYCAGLNLGGYSWRLPSVKELATTVDEHADAPAIDVSAFPGTLPDAWYLSSTAAAPEPAQQWALNYNDGFTSFYGISSGYVRCVR